MSTDLNARRVVILEALDVAAFRELLDTYSVLPVPTDDDVLIAAMHKARYDTLGCTRESRLYSAAWLRGRGMTAVHGVPLLPEGELPE